MVMLAISVGLLFGVGFGAGYSARMAVSWARRARKRRERANGQTVFGVKPVAAAQSAVNDAGSMPVRAANA